MTAQFYVMVLSRTKGKKKVAACVGKENNETLEEVEHEVPNHVEDILANCPVKLCKKRACCAMPPDNKKSVVNFNLKPSRGGLFFD